MPFILANRRKTTQRVQAGPGPIDYTRNPPSSVFYIITNTVISTSYMLGLRFAGLLLSAVFGVARTTRVPIVLPTDPFNQTTMRIKDRFPLQLPSIAITFSRAPTIEIQESLQDVGAQTVRLPGIMKEVWTIKHPNLTTFGAILNLDNVDRVDPPYDHISRRGIEVLPRIMTVIYQVTRLLRMISSSQHLDLSENTITWAAKEEDWDFEKEEKEEGEDENDAIEELPMDFAERFTAIIEYRDDTEEQIFFDIDKAFPRTGRAIVVPYIENAAAPDILALNLFVQSFWHMCFSDDDDATRTYDEWMGAWTKEIMNTTFGKWLAHMIACLRIAVQCGGYVVFLKSGGTYEGAVVFGNLSIKGSQGEDWVHAVEGNELTRELEFFATHSQALVEIIRIAGLEGNAAVNISTITTMRRLGSIIRDHGSLTPTTKNTLGALLPKVVFNERPTPVTAETLVDTIRRMATREELDDTEFMDASAILSDDFTTRLLSRFGSTVPSFGYGGLETVRVCEILGRGVSDEVAYHRSVPTNLQLKRVSLRGAVPQWNSMMITGAIRTDIAKRVKDSRVFPKRESEMIWSALNEEVTKTIERKGVGESSGKRKGGPGDGGSGKAAKRVRAIDFL